MLKHSLIEHFLICAIDGLPFFNNPGQHDCNCLPDFLQQHSVEERVALRVEGLCQAEGEVDDVESDGCFQHVSAVLGILIVYGNQGQVIGKVFPDLRQCSYGGLDAHALNFSAAGPPVPTDSDNFLHHGVHFDPPDDGFLGELHTDAHLTQIVDHLVLVHCVFEVVAEGDEELVPQQQIGVDELHSLYFQGLDRVEFGQDAQLLAREGLLCGLLAVVQEQQQLLELAVEGVLGFGVDFPPGSNGTKDGLADPDQQLHNLPKLPRLHPFLHNLNLDRQLEYGKNVISSDKSGHLDFGVGQHGKYLHNVPGPISSRGIAAVQLFDQPVDALYVLVLYG